MILSHLETCKSYGHSNSVWGQVLFVNDDSVVIFMFEVMLSSWVPCVFRDCVPGKLWNRSPGPTGREPVLLHPRSGPPPGPRLSLCLIFSYFPRGLEFSCALSWLCWVVAWPLGHFEKAWPSHLCFELSFPTQACSILPVAFYFSAPVDLLSWVIFSWTLNSLVYLLVFILYIIPILKHYV